VVSVQPLCSKGAQGTFKLEPVGDPLDDRFGRAAQFEIVPWRFPAGQSDRPHNLFAFALSVLSSRAGADDFIIGSSTRARESGV
jgi:hypothetical protein